MKYMLWGPGEVYANERRMYHVAVRALAKFRQDNSPFEFANEFIGYSLGLLIGLPVVAGVLATREEEECYCSFNINSFAPEQLPPADVEKFAREQSGLAMGIVLFDSWLVHEDRHKRNIVFNEDSGEVFLIDHGEALLKGRNPLPRLQRYSDDPALGSSCLVPYLNNDFVEFWDWWHRICHVPEAAIQGILRRTTSMGVSHQLVEYCTDYLMKRRDKLPEMFWSNRHLIGKKSTGSRSLYTRPLPYDPCDVTTMERNISLLAEAYDWVGR